MDFLKGLAAIAVITLHFPFPESTIKGILFPFLVEMAVPAFLFISGFLSSVSLSKRGITNLENSYKIDEIIRKILRTAIPFTVFFVIEFVIFRYTGLYKVDAFEYGILALFFDWLTGGKGQGSYYFPITFQFVFLFPLIYFAVKRWKYKGLIAMFLTNLSFEIIKTAYGMGEGEYRLLIFRYIFIIACGCFSALSGEWYTELSQKQRCVNVLLMVLSVVAGAGFIFLFTHTAYTPKIIKYWSATSLFSCLYYGPIMYILSRMHFKFLPLEMAGRASFHIFLVQMLYYIYFKTNGLYLREYGLSVLICVSIGVIFWLIDIEVRKLFKLLFIKKGNPVAEGGE